MKHITKRDEAVSPVVGVMLMLVVTIIIAAVVSGFAGGLGGNTDKAPQASITAEEIVVNEAYDAVKTNGGTGGSDWNQDPVTDKCSDVYVVFEHNGGDGINLNNIEIHLGSLKYSHEKSVITTAKTVDPTTYGDHDDIQSDFSKGWDIYIEGYPDGASLISTGSKFVLHADYVREGIETRTGREHESFKKISWLPDGAEGAFSIDVGDYLTYDIIDKQTQKSISSGQILVRDFGVESS
jgi:FlaG/FlaF family flagellin (archaellin)